MKRVYGVTETKEISANDVSCLKQNTDEKRQVTLITCTKDDSSHQTVYIAERV